MLLGAMLPTPLTHQPSIHLADTHSAVRVQHKNHLLHEAFPDSPFCVSAVPSRALDHKLGDFLEPMFPNPVAQESHACTHAHTHRVGTEARAQEPRLGHRVLLAGPGPGHGATPLTTLLHQPLSSPPSNASSDTTFFSFLFCLKNQYTIYVGHSVRSETCALETTTFVPFLFSIIVSLLFSLCHERRAFENASLSAGLSGTRRGL